MKFSDLLDLAYDEHSGRVNTYEIAMQLPDAPATVREVYSDHGRKDQFQAQYGPITISEITWAKVSVSASEIIECSIYHWFSNWTNNVARRPESFSKAGWHCIDVRPNIVDYWSKFRTWVEPPVVLDARLLGRPHGLHLMEGHTRIGILKGLISHGVLQSDSQHYIWLGATNKRGGSPAKPKRLGGRRGGSELTRQEGLSS
jgi:hypothetical protein